MSSQHSPAREGRYGRLLTREEVCRRLGRSPASLHRDIAEGHVPPPLKFGRSARWTEIDIDALVEDAIARRDQGRSASSRSR